MNHIIGSKFFFSSRFVTGGRGGEKKIQNFIYQIISLFMKFLINKPIKIFNDGYLGSHIDEERSEMRYAMRIAETASHQIFERKWRQLNIGMLGSVCVEIIQLNVVEREISKPFLSPIKRGGVDTSPLRSSH